MAKLPKSKPPGRKLSRIERLVIYGIIAFMVCWIFPYQIEEGIGERFQIEVKWDSTAIEQVHYVRVSDKATGKQFEATGTVKFGEQLRPIENGEHLEIVELVSGWWFSRLYSPFVVFEIRTSDQATIRHIVKISKAVLQSRTIEISEADLLR